MSPESTPRFSSAGAWRSEHFERLVGMASNRRLCRDKAAHIPAYLERNMIALRHWNPPGA